MGFNLDKISGIGWCVVAAHRESTWIHPWKRQDSHMSSGLIGLDS